MVNQKQRIELGKLRKQALKSRNEADEAHRIHCRKSSNQVYGYEDATAFGDVMRALGYVEGIEAAIRAMELSPYTLSGGEDE